MIQASWSFGRMQTLGFAYALRPVLEKIYPERDEFLSRLTLHMEYFNTQPYLASFILGAAARLEQDRSCGLDVSTDVSELKTVLMSPLGALGDSFFWGALKPLASLAAVAVLMAGAWWAPFLFLLLYNIWHLRIRAGALFLGFKTTGDAGALMTRYQMGKRSRLFKSISLCLVGGILGMAPVWRPEFRLSQRLPGLLTLLTGLAVTLSMTALLRRGGSPLKLMLGLAAVCLVLAYLGVAA